MFNDPSWLKDICMFSDGALLPGFVKPGAGLPAKDGGVPGASVLTHLPRSGISILQRSAVTFTHLLLIPLLLG